MKTFRFQITDEKDLPLENWQIVQAEGMNQAVTAALQLSSRSRKILLPTTVYLAELNSNCWNNGAPMVVHAFEVTQ
jgi:RES domain-containing protein